MKLVMGLQPQPEFPRQDLSEDNAQLLELMLANEMILADGHGAAERVSWAYKVGHPAIRRAGLRSAVLGHQIEAVNHGVMVYESMAAMLQAAPTRCDTFTVNTNACALVTGLDDDGLFDYIDKAYQQFGVDMPLAAEVVENCSERFYPHLGNCAVIGAGLARQFELDSVA